MRRTTAIVLSLAVALAPAAFAKFGITKTRVTLPRLRPPERPLVAETVALDVRSVSPEVTGSYVSIVSGRLQDAIDRSGMYHLVERNRKADAVVRVEIGDLQAEVRDEVRLETKYVKIGERTEWDEKKKKEVTKDVWGNRKEPVTYRIAEGSVAATVAIEERSSDVGSSYHQEFKTESGIPAEAATEEALKRFLIQGAANRAAALIGFSPDPVEALLAVDGELKTGNRLAESGVFAEALKEWNRIGTLKGDKEAARQHNLGVAHEAIAYSLPPESSEHQSHLEEAKSRYQKALALDPGEKYFTEPIPRIETSISYAEAARALADDLRALKDDRAGRHHERHEGRDAGREGGRDQGEAPPHDQPLRNGSFESGIAPWTASANARVVSEAGRGKVVEAATGGSVRQTVSAPLASSEAALSLEYRVVSGEARIRLHVAYEDTGGKERTSSLDVTAGEGPGRWSPWRADLASLRPRPARITELRVEVEGGSVRLDNFVLRTE